MAIDINGITLTAPSTTLNLNTSSGSATFDSSGRLQLPNQPKAHMYHTAVNSYGSATTEIGWEATRYNVSTAYTGGRLTAPVSGYYAVFYQGNCYTSGSVTMTTSWYRSDGELCQWYYHDTYQGTTWRYAQNYFIKYMTAGQYLYQNNNSGSTILMDSGNWTSVFFTLLG